MSTTTRKKAIGPKRSRRRTAPTTARPSTGNVFADLGLPDSEGRLAKAALAHQLTLLISDAGLTQNQAAARLGIDQPKVSALMRGLLKDFSTDRLFRFVTAMNHDVVISIRHPQDKQNPTVRVSIET